MSVREYIPEKKFPVLIVGILAILLIVVIFFWKQNSADNPLRNNTLAVQTSDTTTKEEVLKTDTDSDGLRNWKESMRGTDPQNPDSDGDGVSDGDEIKLGSDPTMTPSENQAAEEQVVHSATNQSSSTSLSKSEIASREFFAQYMALKKAGALNKDSGNILASNYTNKVLSGFHTNGAFFKTYTASSLEILDSTGDGALKTYGNAMGRVILSNPPVKGKRTAFQVFFKAMTSGNSQDLQKIGPYIDRYENIIKDSLEVPVPQNATSIHLGYLNALSALKTNAEAMKNAEQTPLRTGIIMKAYMNTKEDQAVQNLQNIHKFFVKNGITFSETEPGTAFTGT